MKCGLWCPMAYPCKAKPASPRMISIMEVVPCVGQARVKVVVWRGTLGKGVRAAGTKPPADGTRAGLGSLG
ncbi:hypothetical protein E2C01_028958 [Portunus trituberculatus]|uniref:Uncharacterized protein n=1 Tax=Portunus trituberculatus TaxID=210409 RepID=A0A5B7ERI0_PORTR|nr:hypothetical protein [Portunus trituberculatus]